MVSEWETLTVGDFCPLAYGRWLPEEAQHPEGGVPMLGSNGPVGYHDVALTSGPTLVIGCRGSLGGVQFSPRPCWPIGTTFWYSEADVELLRFKYYALKALQLERVGTGSATPMLTLGAVHGLKILVPPLLEQRAIAHILTTLDDQIQAKSGSSNGLRRLLEHLVSQLVTGQWSVADGTRWLAQVQPLVEALDDRIELNRRTNQTLEAMARAIFQSWFVDFEPVRAKMEGRWRRGEALPGLPAELWDLFPDRMVDSEQGEIPAGWDPGPLGKFFAVGLGGTWGNDGPTDKFPLTGRCLRGVDCHDLAEGALPNVPIRWFSPRQLEDRRLVNGTILVEGSGSFCGRSLLWHSAYDELLGGNVVYSNFCKRLDPMCDVSQAVIGWFQMRVAYRRGVLQSFRTGSAFPNFDIHSALSTLNVAMPSVAVAEAFSVAFNQERLVALIQQSRIISVLLDTLLPKLISGDIRLKHAEDIVGETA